MKPDAQAMFMFTRGHLVLTVDCVVKEKEQRAASLDRRLLDLPGGGGGLAGGPGVHPLLLQAAAAPGKSRGKVRR